MWLLGENIHTSSVCPRSSDPFYVLTYYESLLLGHSTYNNANNRFPPFSVAEQDLGDSKEEALNQHVKGMRTLS